MDDFTAEATANAVRIMAEKELPEFVRTLRPLDAGGIAGGVKFVIGRVFYKVLKKQIACFFFDVFFWGLILSGGCGRARAVRIGPARRKGGAQREEKMFCFV